jgi:hypothetical protein
MVDAMIFILIIGLLVAVVHQSRDDYVMNEASDVTNAVFSAKVRISDVTDKEDELILPLTDVIAASLVLGDDNVLDYLREILDGVTARPGAYLLEMKYKEYAAILGTGAGECMSGCEKDVDVAYGGELHISLRLY